MKCVSEFNLWSEVCNDSDRSPMIIQEDMSILRPRNSTPKKLEHPHKNNCPPVHFNHQAQNPLHLENSSNAPLSFIIGGGRAGDKVSWNLKVVPLTKAKNEF